ncbi:uncharacterized protein [Amphiura filiformis]|uniref:uncharacterized protein n=1 Tax=Amphiura filiformis TaxID=82378 RepID=UPI003B21D27D
MKDAKKRIDESLQYLSGVDDFCTDEAYEAIYCIWELPRKLAEDIPDDKREVFVSHTRSIAEYFQQKNFVRPFIKIMTSVHQVLQTEERSLAMTIIYLLLSIFANFSDQSLLLCREFGMFNGIESVLQIVGTLASLKSEDNNILEDSILSSLALLHNCIRHCAENRSIYRRANAVEILSKLRKGDTTDMMVLLILAYIVNDEESVTLAKSEDCVRMLTKLLAEAVSRDDHYGIAEKEYFCSAIELLDGLNHLAINDANKAEIAKHGGIHSIIRMLQPDFSEEEHVVATQALWNLSFLDSIKRTSEVQATLPTLRSLTTSENQPIREASSYAVWEIQDNQRAVEHPNDDDPPPSYQESVEAHAQSGPSGHVMISYQWDSQDRVIAIRDNLVQAGYKVWMDVHNIRKFEYIP